jgi:phenylacetate-CoA ligase
MHKKPVRQIDFYKRELETMDRTRLREPQEQRLRCLLRELTTNEFYREKFRHAGLAIESVRSAEDLKRSAIYYKRELAAEQQAHPPYGRLLTYPLARYAYLHQTSGTTAQPLKWLDTREDWETWLRCWGYVFRAAGVNADDLVFCAFSFGPYVSHWLRSMARGIPARCASRVAVEFEQRLRMIIDNRCTVLVCTPTYALIWPKWRTAGADLRSSSVRITIHAGEPGASVENVKRRIEDAWGPLALITQAQRKSARGPLIVRRRAAPFISTNWSSF